jgi:succinoglycan biosynthesis protein ExoV
MKLYYFKDPSGNFGDDLNVWLWPRLAPEIFDEAHRELFVGIGTLINHRLPFGVTKHVFGSGYGYGIPPAIDCSFVFHAVRGFKTAAVLGLPSETVLTDSAILIRAVDVPKAPRPLHRCGFVATGESIHNYDWSQICDEIGIRFISCHWSVERVLEAMSECETILAEAMHGAIVADALRIPWIPVVCNDGIFSFKWEDWLSSLGLQYRPSRVISLYDLERNLNLTARAKNRVKQGVAKLGINAQRWSLPHRRSSAQERAQAVQELLEASRREPFLSDDARIESLTSRYLDLLNSLRTWTRDGRPIGTATHP